MENHTHRGTVSKKLFSLFRIYDYNKKDYAPMMHVYKRNLSPIRENYQQCNLTSPYEDNFLVFSGSEGGLFETMSRFKHQYLASNENVKISSKSKNFQTFSLVEPKERRKIHILTAAKEYKISALPIAIENTSEQYKKTKLP